VDKKASSRGTLRKEPGCPETAIVGLPLRQRTSLKGTLGRGRVGNERGVKVKGRKKGAQLDLYHYWGRLNLEPDGGIKRGLPSLRV